MAKEKKVKCFIVNNDVDIFQFEILDGVITNQVEMVARSGKRYILGNFPTLKEAKDYVRYVLRIEAK